MGENPLMKVVPGLLPFVFLGLVGTQRLLRKRRRRRGLIRAIQIGLVIQPAIAAIAFLALPVEQAMDVTLGNFAAVGVMLLALIVITIIREPPTRSS